MLLEIWAPWSGGQPFQSHCQWQVSSSSRAIPLHLPNSILLVSCWSELPDQVTQLGRDYKELRGSLEQKAELEWWEWYHTEPGAIRGQVLLWREEAARTEGKPEFARGCREMTHSNISHRTSSSLPRQSDYASGCGIITVDLSPLEVYFRVQWKGEKAVVVIGRVIYKLSLDFSW